MGEIWAYLLEKGLANVGFFFIKWDFPSLCEPQR